MTAKQRMRVPGLAWAVIASAASPAWAAADRAYVSSQSAGTVAVVDVATATLFQAKSTSP